MTNPLSELGRLCRVAVRSRVLGELHPLRARAALRVLRARGLRVQALFPLHAVQAPHRLALIDGRSTRTYAQAAREIERLGAGLRALGVGPGAAVVVAMENRVEYVLAWFAVMQIGARVVHAGSRLPKSELDEVVRRSSARAVLVDEGAVEVKAELVIATDDVRGHPELVRWSRVLALAGDEPAPVASSAESIVYTSGTTGRPKGAVRDFARFGIVEGARVLERLPFRFGDRHLVVAPLHHSGAQAFTLIHVALAGTVHLADRFDAEETLVRLSRDAIHSIFVVPTMLRRLLELPLAAFVRHPLPRLRAIVCGAGELTPALRDAAIARFGARRVFDFYGATELGWVTLVDGEEMQRNPGSIGRPLAGQEIAILDRAGNPLPTGEIGLVYVRNAQTMSRYLDDADATRAMRRGAWATVEDLGFLDRAGHLHLAGRARDMVKTGGVNVYPIEIEQALAAQSSVGEIAVVGVPDVEWGERLVAFVTPATGKADVDVRGLDRLARRTLAAPKVPKEWIVIDALPRNELGKIAKAELRALAARRRDASAGTSLARGPGDG